MTWPVRVRNAPTHTTSCVSFESVDTASCAEAVAFRAMTSVKGKCPVTGGPAAAHRFTLTSDELARSPVGIQTRRLAAPICERFAAAVDTTVDVEAAPNAGSDTARPNNHRRAIVFGTASRKVNSANARHTTPPMPG